MESITRESFGEVVKAVEHSPAAQSCFPIRISITRYKHGTLYTVFSFERNVFVSGAAGVLRTSRTKNKEL